MGHKVLPRQRVPRASLTHRNPRNLILQVALAQALQRGAVPDLGQGLPRQIAQHIYRVIVVRAWHHAAIPHHRQLGPQQATRWQPGRLADRLHRRPKPSPRALPRPSGCRLAKPQRQQRHLPGPVARRLEHRQTLPLLGKALHLAAVVVTYDHLDHRSQHRSRGPQLLQKAPDIVSGARKVTAPAQLRISLVTGGIQRDHQEVQAAVQKRPRLARIQEAGVG